MAEYMSRTAPGASPESFRENIQAIVVECVGEKLRHQDLETFDKEQDEALRNIPSNVKSVTWFAEQHKLYIAKCREYLEHVRPELHRAIDTLIDNLEEEAVRSPDGQSEAVTFRAPHTPLMPGLTSNAFPGRSAPVFTFGPSQPRAPEAAMDALSGRGSSPTRSETMLAEDSRPAARRAVFEPLFVDPDVVGGQIEADNSSPIDPAPPRACADILSTATDAPSGSKRRTGNEVTREESNKRRRCSLPNDNDAPFGNPRTPKLKPIDLAQVKPDECIFRYKDMPGFYVLRCNNTKCKERLRTNGPYYFRAHPFQWNRAVNHFGGDGHGIKKEDGMFRSYARKVSDATEERNLSSPKARQPQTPNTPNSELPEPSEAAALKRPVARAPLTPASPSNNNNKNNNSRDKGKQRESPILLDFDDDDDSSFNGEDAAGLQSSGSTTAEALSRSQPYPTRSRVIIPDVEMLEGHEDEESEEDPFYVEFPSLADWSKSARRSAPS
ncbi:hypothetical protein PG995_013557 [Apiospora arundinis]